MEMKKLSNLCIFLFALCFQTYSLEMPPLNTPQEIEIAMNAMKSDDPEIYNYLAHLKSNQAPDFKQRLHNHYFAYLQKKEMNARIPVRELGYREKIKLSDKQIKLLQEKLSMADHNQKDQILKQINNASVERYQIELERKEKQIAREQKRLDKQNAKLERFKKNKNAFIQSLEKKILGSAKK